MKILTTLYLTSIVALALAVPAAAQDPSWSQRGDHYAPGSTTVQQPSAAQTQQAKEGDYYAPGKTTVEQPSAAQLRQDKQGDYYAPDKGN
jgi:hypothetical protein